MRIVWEWPRGHMAWFLWNWRFMGARWWRIGPLTVFIGEERFQ